MAPVTRQVWISGRVQGVGFRAWTKREALALSLTGWVRNLPDDRVEACIQGAADAVEAMLQAFHRGPAYAQVSSVESKEPDKAQAFRDFSILR